MPHDRIVAQDRVAGLHDVVNAQSGEHRKDSGKQDHPSGPDHPDQTQQRQCSRSIKKAETVHWTFLFTSYEFCTLRAGLQGVWRAQRRL